MTSGPAGQPDILYHPDRAKWEARTAQRLAEDPSLLKTPLPSGFPSNIKSTLAWEGADWTHESQWVYNLTQEDLQEIDLAVRHFHNLKLPTGLAAPKTFPLPTLGPKLQDLAQELYGGRGFFVLRTIPISLYPIEDVILIYAGVSSYVAPVRGLQDKNGGVLAHITDLSHRFGDDRIGSPAYTTDKQVFHTDQGVDIVSLFALDTAKEGGVSRISSSWRVYNELAEKRPDLVKTLSDPWDVEEFGLDPPYTSRPLLYYLDSRIIIQYARRYFTGFQGLPRSRDVPPITEAQAEALDALHFVGEKYSLGLNFQKGEYNGYRDDETQKRHLLRLWLRNEELAWELPDELKPLWKRTFSVHPDDQTFAAKAVIREPAKGKQKPIN
ncbi:taurine catabolism dioxygenase TauD [Coprinopsis marcescibilis]|uniref:Taurine catabolism dioxygenase TauD n=1 Tax=Coprinopsis marcescibilis TaxID=230819 RepID=A0A5C3KN54_COPMA|nr:taurine catabolism dioxygenase TauD [Coprinopsis marcescibilis]